MPLDSSDSDRIRLKHMLEAALHALSFARSRNRADLNGDVMFRRAVVNCIQELGKAASKISAAGRARAPNVPWRQIVGMRQRLVHNYFNIDLDLLWDVLDRELRPLVEALEAALNAWPPAQGHSS